MAKICSRHPRRMQINYGLGGEDANLMNPQTLKSPKTGTLTNAPSTRPGQAETNLINPMTLKIQTTHTLPKTFPSMNIIPTTLNCVVPRFICTSAPLVHMVIEFTIIIQGGKKVVMMTSPTMLSCFVLVLASFTHVDSLSNEEERALAFGKVVRSFLSCMHFLTFAYSSLKMSCPKSVLS